jgi:lipase chaperone LimK
MKSSFDILEKIDEVNFRWLEAAQDLQSAKSRIEERQVLSPSEYVIFDPLTQQIVAKSNSMLRCAVLPPRH